MKNYKVIINKFTPHLHQKSEKLASNIVLFLVLMLLIKFVLNSTIRRCSYCTNFLNSDAKFTPNTYDEVALHH